MCCLWRLCVHACVCVCVRMSMCVCVCFLLLSSDFRDNFPDSFQHNYKSFSLQTSAPGASCPAEKRSVNRCEVALAKM